MYYEFTNGNIVYCSGCFSLQRFAPAAADLNGALYVAGGYDGRYYLRYDIFLSLIFYTVTHNQHAISGFFYTYLKELNLLACLLSNFLLV